MKHSYLYRPGRWTAQGEYIDESGRTTALTSEVELRRNAEGWILAGFMEVAFPDIVHLENAYVLKETADACVLVWESFNPALGTLRGSFTMVGEYVLSFYQSADGRHAGTETLARLSETQYEAVGAVFCEGKRLSSWTARLEGTFFEEEPS